MSKKAPPNSSNTARTAILFLAIIAGGWLFIQLFQGENPGKEAFIAKEEMLNQQSRAENANAPSLAEVTYGEALMTAQQGEQELAEGNHTAAKISFEFAAELFGAATREASENAESPVRAEEDGGLKQSAISARAETFNLKGQATDAGARTMAKSVFNDALQEEQRARQGFEAGDYSQAAFSYEKAGKLFRQSRDEAQAQKLGAEPDLSAVRKTVERLRQEMQQEKTAAEQSDSKKWAAERFEQAQKKERDGNNNFQAGTKKGFLTAQKLYSDAKDAYRNARKEAENKARNADAVRTKEAETAAKETETANELRKETEAARTDMIEMRNFVVSSASEKRGNANYQEASRRATDGESAFRSGEYRAAMQLFQEARRLYAQASEEIVRRLEERAEEDAPKEKEQTAKREIQSLINRFEQGLEGGDLNMLVSVKENEKVWADFFRNVKNISARTNVGNEKIDVENGTARISFTVNISYYLKNKKETKNIVFSRDWDLEFIRGEWVIVFSKLN